jgi:hypothetical protein
MTPLAVGTLVLHPNRPEWGPGKVVRVTRDFVHVVFRDLSDREAKPIRTDAITLLIAPEQHDDILAHLPPLTEKDGKLLLPKERLTLVQAVKAFRSSFPLGFDDPKYVGNLKRGERLYKWAAHELFVQHLGEGQLRKLATDDPVEGAHRAMKCVQRTNLLHMTEQVRLKEALAVSGAAAVYLAALADLLDASDINEAAVVPYFRAVAELPADEKRRVASWPVATILPFLAQPERHFFLKPKPMNDAADRLGFHLNYRSEPNWLTYSCALQMAAVYSKHLAPLKPRDMIDIQSFFWVAANDGAY